MRKISSKKKFNPSFLQKKPSAKIRPKKKAKAKANQQGKRKKEQDDESERDLEQALDAEVEEPKAPTRRLRSKTSASST